MEKIIENIQKNKTWPTEWGDQRQFPVFNGQWKVEWGDPMRKTGNDQNAWDAYAHRKRVVEDAANEVAIRMQEKDETADEAFNYLVWRGDLAFGNVADKIYDEVTYYESVIKKLAQKLLERAVKNIL